MAMGRSRTRLAVARWENEGGAVKHDAPSGPRRGPSLDDDQAWRDPDPAPVRESSSTFGPTGGHSLASGLGGGVNQQDLAGPQGGRRADAPEGETRAPRLR